MNERLKDRIAEEWAQLDPVDPLRGLLSDVIDVLAQPAQEPVAWLDLLKEARDNCKASIAEDGISAMRKEYRVDLERRLTAALTTPQQRPWVGLTGQEQALIVSVSKDVPDAIYRANAKLKELNT
jgi:hypothetical protein